MLGRVVKPFAFAADGYTVCLLNEGDERDFGAAAHGLLSEGFILADGEIAGEPVVEPEVVVKPEPAAEPEPEAVAELEAETSEEPAEAVAEEKPARRTRK